MIKSPLRYPGGKSRAIDLIAPLLPFFDEYREPFLGGGSVFINTKQRFLDKMFWINDIYYELYKFWEISQKDINSLTNKIYEWKQRFRQGKELHNFLNTNMACFNEIEQAAAFFIYNRITFSGTTLSGGYSEAAFFGRFTESSIQKLYNFSKIIQNTSITNLDYEELVMRDGNNVFIFLDPPYYSAKKSALYGKNGNLHKIFNHERFANIMKNCKHKWLITYDECEYIKNIFSFANIIPYSLRYGMRNVSKTANSNGREVFISNYLDILPRRQQLTLKF
jgi:DNA adenine methylase